MDWPKGSFLIAIEVLLLEVLKFSLKTKVLPEKAKRLEKCCLEKHLTRA